MKNEYKNILLATNFSNKSRILLNQLLEYADEHNSKISIINVYKRVRLPYDVSGVCYHIEEQLEEKAKAEMKKLTCHCASRLSNIIVTAANHPSDAIVCYAKELKCDAVYMNRYKHNILMSLFSVPTRVANSCECDVVYSNTVKRSIKAFRGVHSPNPQRHLLMA